ncbi:conserved hypothetical protein [Gloeothece citriformis PCC 7424]|uniref:DUF3318 domain-containing protein n=1 Tax=Gloeothece citriformis (strain PCC 7424) TaxID=65393 RepID=B7K8B4_GLOC7|nr:DUF3318 domain-containing protein [Gloeothece citriformis]ACK69874.1 conserved hypothetical protein [Gloeothece citriformis PCC 7424]
MNLDSEISRLLDLMPASGRMLTRIVSKPQQTKVIDFTFPLPWQRGTRYIYINFDLLRRLSRPQRDLILLRAVSVLINVQWFKPNIYQGITVAALVGLTVELIQTDAVGIVIAGGLTTLAVNQIWRNNRSVQRELDADEAAIKVALRRGYSETEAALQLLSGIEAVAQLEGRSSLSFSELIRCQNLKAIANISPIGVPDSVKQE